MTSLFDLYKIGIGPSSSHTVGPMRAAYRFIESLESQSPEFGSLLQQTASVVVDLYGSLALTGLGHGTDRAILLGLMGERADSIDPAAIDPILAAVEATGELKLLGRHTISFHKTEGLIFHRGQMYPGRQPTHPNGMRFTARASSGEVLAEEVFYSVGGGFILSEQQFLSPKDVPGENDSAPKVPYRFTSAAELLERAETNRLPIWQLMLANEAALRTGSPGGKPSRDENLNSENQVREGIFRLWRAMVDCAERGMVQQGILPGGLNVRRRAARLAERLREKAAAGLVTDPLAPMDWVTVYAMAVNEENAAGSRVVTAPTNGAAGVIPAVGMYFLNFLSDGRAGSASTGAANTTDDGILRYLLTSAAIGILYKENASISGAEVGCQGEVGVACSMAAGGLVAALNGTNEQIEHAAEIGMEHNLGMTCDPIGGLVQIPCIERNAIGAVKAIQACRMAMNETEGHKISLDQVIETMYRTGLDMQSRYKETSLAGLALNVIEC